MTTSLIHTCRLIFAQIDRHFVVRVFMLIVVISSAMSVIYDIHVTRTGYIDLADYYQQEIAELDRHGRLLIEKSALTSPHRLEGRATALFDMRIPDPENIEIWP